MGKPLVETLGENAVKMCALATKGKGHSYAVKLMVKSR